MIRAIQAHDDAVEIPNELRPHLDKGQMVGGGIRDVQMLVLVCMPAAILSAAAIWIALSEAGRVRRWDSATEDAATERQNGPNKTQQDKPR